MPAVAIAAAVALGSTLAVRQVRAGRRAGLTVTQHRIPWHGTRPIRVAQLTDVHVGLTTPRRTLARIAEVVRDMRCDVVVMTGDYVNMSVFHVGRVTELVRALPQPCIAVLGNHDHWSGAERVTRALESGGAKVLRNAHATVRGEGWSLVVVGVDDGRSDHDDVDLAFSGVERPERALVLTHDPRTATSIAKTRAPLVLSGHTHAGQIHVPRVVPLVAKLAGHPYLRGFHRIDRTDLYVSAGVGHSLSGLRSEETAPEIAVFELDPGVRQRSSSVMRTPFASR